MSKDEKKEEWLKVYYSRLESENAYSLKKKDTFTNWSLIILVGLISIYFGFHGSEILNDDLRFLLLTGFIIVLIQFFGNSLISYAYLRKWRYLTNQIDSYWMNGKPSMEKIQKDITTYDLGNKTIVGSKNIVSAQLRSGFHIILGGPTALWIYELITIEQLTWLHGVGFVILGGFILYQILSLRSYDKLKQEPTT